MIKKSLFIKKFVLIISAVLLFASFVVKAEPSDMPMRLVYGDLNSDGVCNSTDYSIFNQFLLDKIEKPANPYFDKCADLNSDSRINSIDYSLMKKFILGVIDTLPYGGNEVTPTPTQTPFNNPNKNYEIERKFLIKVDKIPYDLNTFDKYSLTQAYISFSPEVRVRKANDNMFWFCVKTPVDSTGLVREEHEFAITEEEYLYLFNKTEGNVITKDRYQGPVGHYIYCIDIFSGMFEGLAFMEVGFDSVEEANNFIVPDWVEKDVTSDKRYKNGSLARFGLQDIEL
ncbi:MAG: hypothetical protein GX660_14715 [Clostridiaceae bacterium]|nr:hypothetical protein [Clostridiaceae bacterium]